MANIKREEYKDKHWKIVPMLPKTEQNFLSSPSPPHSLSCATKCLASLLPLPSSTSTMATVPSMEPVKARPPSSRRPHTEARWWYRVSF